MSDGASFPVILIAAAMVSVGAAVLVAVLLETMPFRRWRRHLRRTRERSAHPMFGA